MIYIYKCFRNANVAKSDTKGIKPMMMFRIIDVLKKIENETRDPPLKNQKQQNKLNTNQIQKNDKKLQSSQSNINKTSEKPDSNKDTNSSTQKNQKQQNDLSVNQKQTSEEELESILKRVLGDFDIFSGKRNIGYPLHKSSFKGMLEAVQFFISDGCDIEEKDNNGYNPLIIASHEGHLEVVKCLITAGANKEGKDDEGKPHSFLLLLKVILKLLNI